MANVQNGIFEGKFFIYELDPGELIAAPLYTHYEQNGKYVSLFKYRLTNKDKLSHLLRSEIIQPIMVDWTDENIE